MQEQTLITETIKKEMGIDVNADKHSDLSKQLALELDKSKRHYLDKEIYVSESAIGGDFSCLVAERALDLF